MFNTLKQDDGFSLLELIVAIAIISLALLPMIASQSTAIKSSADLSERGYASIVAENIMTDFTAAELPPLPGTISGEEFQGGIGFDWQAVVREQSPLITISLTVKRVDQDKVLYHLTGFRKTS
ncbi:type II secretion system protein [Pseudemcibacter aquimaris]|uniref:type II secretion system protein n=1 Tax=Pseudemcibacter aquimaris TaxID=2857064 RepID=UPI002012B641|nr:type II secretion system protein [Pseudemcibacter aquimaris]MCC3861758.1 type II secretion system protein [Pseudemcibacter aquimaris]WDU60269.1 type II secretion system protein [Pseudemcibacter aquimaris]